MCYTGSEKGIASVERALVMGEALLCHSKEREGIGSVISEGARRQLVLLLSGISGDRVGLGGWSRQ